MYKIVGLTPPKEYKMGGYGFMIELDPNFAREAAKLKLTQTLYDDFQTATSDILKTIKMDLGHRHVLFRLNDSWLATNFSVQGNACGLDVILDRLDEIMDEKNQTPIIYPPSINRIIYPLKYYSHNIDSHLQAYALLSIFSYWYDLVESLMYVLEKG